MALIIGTILAVLSALVIVYPFFQSRWQDRSTNSDSPEPPEILDLDSVYDSIRTLQLERQLGNIPEGLYQEQLRAYRLQAAAALRSHAQAEAQDADWALEEEVRFARTAARGQAASATLCPNCGTRLSVAATRCGECDIDLDPLSTRGAQESEG